MVLNPAIVSVIWMPVMAFSRSTAPGALLSLRRFADTRLVAHSDWSPKSTPQNELRWMAPSPTGRLAMYSFGARAGFLAGGAIYRCLGAFGARGAGRWRVRCRVVADRLFSRRLMCSHNVTVASWRMRLPYLLRSAELSSHSMSTTC